MLQYISEFKNRILYFFLSLIFSIIICYIYKESILLWLSLPIIQLNSTKYFYFIYTNLTDIFWIYLHVIIFITSIIIIPFALLQIWFFFKHGLYKKEKRHIKKLSLITIITLFLLAYITYYYVIQYSWRFFYEMSANQNIGLLNVHLEAKLNEYINFIFKLYFNSFLFAQTWISFFYFLIILKKKDLQILCYARKYVYVIIVIFSSLITPPDIFSQIIISLPFIILYEFFLLIFLITNK